MAKKAARAEKAAELAEREKRIQEKEFELRQRLAQAVQVLEETRSVDSFYLRYLVLYGCAMCINQKITTRVHNMYLMHFFGWHLSRSVFLDGAYHL